MPKEGMKKIADDIISSYESRIESMANIFNTTRQLLNDFQDSFFDMKNRREEIKRQLQDQLAKTESLRRKDFDKMVEDILSTQDQREKSAREMVDKYLITQKNMAEELKKNLENFKESITKGETQRIKEYRDMIKEILTQQEKRKKETTSQLREFQKEQKGLMENLNTLLAKGKNLRIGDVKSMLREFGLQHKEEIPRCRQRTDEVQKKHDEFKKERIERAQDWHNALERVAKERLNLYKKIHPQLRFSYEGIKIDKKEGKSKAKREY